MIAAAAPGCFGAAFILSAKFPETKTTHEITNPPHFLAQLQRLETNHAVCRPKYMIPAPTLISKQTAGRLALLVPGLLFLGGCVVEERRPMRHAVYVEAAPLPPVETVMIDVPPPPPQEEIIVEQPSPDRKAHV